MAHNIKVNKLKYNHFALYGRLKSTVFSSRLKALWSVISWNDVGSEFHGAGPVKQSSALHGMAWNHGKAPINVGDSSVYSIVYLL